MPRWILGALFLALSALLCEAGAFAGDYSKSALGTTGAQFLELPVGARAIAMGSAQGAVAQDATALYYNPAGLAGIQGGDLALMHAAYFQSISYQYGAVAQRIGNLGTIAIGAQYLSPGSLDEVDNTGVPTGNDFKPNDLAVALGFGRSIGRLDIGVGAKYIHSKIQENASAFAADVGSRFRFNKSFALSASVANLGQGLKFRDKREKLPTTVRLGAGYSLKRLLFAADAIAPRGAQVIFAGGAEYRQPIVKAFSLATRAGYNSRTASSELGGMTGLSVGAGIAFNSLSVDYAWSPYGDLGDAHRLSLGLRWGN